MHGWNVAASGGLSRITGQQRQQPQRQHQRRPHRWLRAATTAIATKQLDIVDVPIEMHNISLSETPQYYTAYDTMQYDMSMFNVRSKTDR